MDGSWGGRRGETLNLEMKEISKLELVVRLLCLIVIATLLVSAIKDCFYLESRFLDGMFSAVGIFGTIFLINHWQRQGRLPWFPSKKKK